MFGLQIDLSAPEQLREVESLDGPGRGEGARPRTGSVAAAVTSYGQIDARVFQRILNAMSMFGIEHSHCSAISHFLRVRVQVPMPDIMHYTYPRLPTTRGARNADALHDLVPLPSSYTARHHIMAMRGVSAERVTAMYRIDYLMTCWWAVIHAL